MRSWEGSERIPLRFMVLSSSWEDFDKVSEGTHPHPHIHLHARGHVHVQTTHTHTFFRRALEACLKSFGGLAVRGPRGGPGPLTRSLQRPSDGLPDDPARKGLVVRGRAGRPLRSSSGLTDSRPQVSRTPHFLDSSRFAT